MRKNEKQCSLTQGGVARAMLLFALPIFCSNLFQQLYNAVDSLIVGNFLGGEALAAVGSSGSLIMLLVGFVNGMSLGAGVLVARFFGAGDRENLERAVHTTVALGLAAGLVLTVAGVLFTPQLLRWMGTPEDVIGSSVVLYNVGAGILQSVGDSRSPMVYLLVSSAANVALDLLFVAVLRWGVASAALATAISQALSAVLSFRKLAGPGTAYRVRWRRVRFDPGTLRQVLGLGLPSGVQNSVISLANVIVQANINAFGSAAMAGCGAYSKVEGFAFLPITCFALALSTFVSQNVGAGRYDRVKQGMRFGLLCSPLLAEGVGLGMYLLAPRLIAAFNSEPQVVAYGVNYARTVSLFYCLLAFSHCCAGLLRGLGRPVIPMGIMLAVWCVLRITYITLTVRVLPTIRVVYWAYPLTWGISSVLFALCLARLRFPPMPGPAAEPAEEENKG